MSIGIWMLIIIFLLCIFIIYAVRQGNSYRDITKQLENETTEKNNYMKRLSDNKKTYQYLWDVKLADENIFNFIRCINFPKTPSCKEVDNGTICRSRQIDCNKFKLVLENDPIAVQRMKLITQTI